jgi:hypothetical protein
LRFIAYGWLLHEAGVPIQISDHRNLWSVAVVTKIPRDERLEMNLESLSFSPTDSSQAKNGYVFFKIKVKLSLCLTD